MTLKLYRNCKLTPDKNFAVDDITTYLNSLRKVAFNNLNYFKQKLNTSILLELGESSLDFSSTIYNYCSIQNDSEKIAYYFVINREWRSKNVVVLTLIMDTVATLGILPMTNKTLIHREHKNRFRYDAHANTIIPIIDKVSEGIVPQLYKSNEKEIVEYNNMKWYVAYISNNDVSPTDYNQVNPVQRVFIPEASIETPIGNYADLTGSSIPISMDLMFSPQTMKTNHFKAKFDNDLDLALGKVIYPRETAITYLVMRRYSTNIEYEIRVYTRKYDGTETDTIARSGYAATARIYNCPAYAKGFKSLNTITSPFHPYNITFSASSSSYTITGLQDMNLTSSKLIKIIELPYCPLVFTVNQNYPEQVTFEANLETGHNAGLALRYPEYDDEFVKGAVYASDVDLYKYAYNTLNIDSRTRLFSDQYSKMNEPKLLHSEFYNLKFVYDSFQYLFKFEEVKMLEFNKSNFTLYLKPSANVGSSFVFDFTASFPLTTTAENYPNFLPITRNNEVAIYNNAYMNYIRTGYNYDVKAKLQQENSAVLSTGFTIAGSVASMALGVASQNPVIAVGAIVGGVTAITSSITSAVNTSINATNSLEQKMAQLRAQATTVSNVDELSLLTYYTKGNIGKLVEFTPSDNMQEHLLRLFHYTGYKAEYMGIPRLNTRLRFNFIQATIDIDMTNEALLYNVSKEILDDYKARFEVGLTYFHNFNPLVAADYWDFEQNYENWETILQNHIS